MTEGSADKALQLSSKVVQGKYSRYIMVCNLFFSLLWGKKTLLDLCIYIIPELDLMVHQGMKPPNALVESTKGC